MVMTYSNSATEIFYSNGGYARTDNGTAKYITDSTVNYTFMPQSEAWFNAMALVTLSVTITGSNSTTGNAYDDIVLAEYALYCADQRLDTVRRDPVTGQPENRHYENALRMLLDKYGVYKDGELIAPRLAYSASRPYPYMIVADGTA